MTALVACQLIGQWQIIEADLWDRDFLDLVEPAMLVIQAENSNREWSSFQVAEHLYTRIVGHRAGAYDWCSQMPTIRSSTRSCHSAMMRMGNDSALPPR